jgi:hypothetical protein
LSYASIQGGRIYSFQNLNSIYIFIFIHFSCLSFKLSDAGKKRAKSQYDLALTSIEKRKSVIFEKMHFHGIFQRYTP